MSEAIVITSIDGHRFEVTPRAARETVAALNEKFLIDGAPEKLFTVLIPFGDEGHSASWEFSYEKALIFAFSLAQQLQARENAELRAQLEHLGSEYRRLCGAGYREAVDIVERDADKEITRVTRKYRY